jgi:hypothetical protein
MDELVVNFQKTQLTLGLQVTTDAHHVRLSRRFPRSFLYWKEQRALVALPEFFFSFDLALNVRNPGLDDLLRSLLYHYTRALKLPTKRDEYESSSEADHLSQLNRITLRQLSRRSEIECLLGKAALSEISTLYRERRYRPQGNDYDNDVDMEHLSEAEMPQGEQEHSTSGHRNTFFDVVLVDEDREWPRTDAFQSVVRVYCRTHVIACTMVAYLFPLVPHPTSTVSATNPAPTSGRTFFLDGGTRATGYLVRRSPDLSYRGIFTGEKMQPCNRALQLVVQQLGEHADLHQKFIHVRQSANRPLDVDRVVLAPVASPSYHSVLGDSGAIPCPATTLLASTRIQVRRTPGMEIDDADDTVLPKDIDVLSFADMVYLGLLTRDCSIDMRFRLASMPGSQPTRPAKAPNKTVLAKRQKRMRTLDDATDTASGVPRAKRIRLMIDTLPFQNFLVNVQRATNLVDFMRTPRADFIEVLGSALDKFDIPWARLFDCLYLSSLEGWHSPDSALVEIFHRHLDTHCQVQLDMTLLRRLRDEGVAFRHRLLRIGPLEDEDRAKLVADFNEKTLLPLLSFYKE